MSPEQSAAKADVLIVGAGIVGVSAALQLQQRGKKVVILDKGNPLGRASYGNSGVISRALILPMAGPSIVPKLPSYALNRSDSLRIRYRDFASHIPWAFSFLRACSQGRLEANVDALNLLVSVAKEHHVQLAEDLDTLSWLRDSGWLRLYLTPEDMQAAHNECHWYEQYGIEVETLSSREIQDTQPQLRVPSAGATFFPDAVVVSQPGRLVERALEAFQARGGKVIHTHVQALEQMSHGVVARTLQGPVFAHQAVLAGGVHAQVMAKALGYRIQMIAGRGYHIHYPLDDHIHFDRSITNVSQGFGIGPEPGGVRLVTGIELAHPDSPPNYHQIKMAVARFAKLIGQSPPETGLPPAQEVWLGSRPMTSDGLPVICRAPRHERIVFAFGHSHIGFATGPVTGRLVANLVTHEAPCIPLDAFDVRRFAGN